MDAEHHHSHHHDQRGWVRPGGRRGRWLEPFLLLLVTEGEAHGYALIGRLNDLGVAPEGVDVGMAYRTLRELETDGLVASEWVAEGGAPRREYRPTPKGRSALAEWASLMCERGRLIDDFLAREARLERDEGG
jgi:DNA-binding PadR family transcriptional regulator